MMTDIIDYLRSSYLRSDNPRSDVNSPFFLIVGDTEYSATKERLSALFRENEIVGISNYCTSSDRVPNTDNLFEDLKSGKIKVLIGLGEYLALNGDAFAFDMLSKLQDFDLNGNKVILLLRCVREIVKKLQNNDLRFDRKRVAYSDNCRTNLTLTCVHPELKLPSACDGLKNALAMFEDGNTVDVLVKTKRKFPNHLIKIYDITTAYDGVRHLLPTFTIPCEYGSDENWEDLLIALVTAGGDLSVVFRNCGFSENLIDDFDMLIQGVSYRNWLYFIALKLKINEIQNSYLKYALEKTAEFDNLKNNVLNAIIEIPHTDNRFARFYRERRELIAKFNEADIAAFVRDNKIDLAESLYKLTDQTQTELEELVALFGILDEKTVLNRTEIVYTDIYDYLRLYSFSDPKLNDELRKELTDYFDSYKWQKITNRFKEGFIDYVESLARDRRYNLLQSRTDIIKGIDKTDAKLYWLDALGVEFLGFIQASCKRLGLALKIHIGRAELPTITSKNRDFYDEWSGDDKENDKNLDEIKHKDEGGYNYENNKLPIHIVRELKVINAALGKIAIELSKHNYTKVLLASDHGASRLAVIKEQEEKYDADERGEHGGRCCKSFPNHNLPFAAEENGYLILADYGRFKGSRKANVEVHGGASLEEVVVPIIEISLANPNIKVQLVSNVIYADYRTCAEFVIFSNVKLNDVKAMIEGKLYAAVKTDENHYKVTTDIKRARNYQADVFDGDSLIGKVAFTVQGKNRRNSDFDF